MTNAPASTVRRICACRAVHGFDCQFPDAPASFYLDQKDWCRFHLPLRDAQGEPSPKAEWTDSSMERRNFENEILKRLLSSLPKDDKQDGRADFRQVVFPDDFSLTTLIGVKNNREYYGDFTAGSFGNHTNFTGLHFGCFTFFTGATFGNGTKFENTNFATDADFSNVTFAGDVNFNNARFYSASFSETDFQGGSNFESVTFQNAANFTGVTFGSSVTFNSAKFGFFTKFTDAIFEDLTYFNDAIFEHSTRFTRTTFGNVAEFTSAFFGRDTDFTDATFEDAADFFNTTFGRGVNFSQAKFGGSVNFSTDSDLAFRFIVFRKARFKGAAIFENRTFATSALLDGAIFHDLANFHGCKFHPGMSFHKAKFLRTKGGHDQEGFAIDTQTEELERAYRTLKLGMENLRARNEEATFFAREMECRRQRSDISFFERFAAFVYKYLSNYGLSVLRPIVWLIGLTAFMWGIYYITVRMSLPDSPTDMYDTYYIFVDPWEKLRFTLEQIFRPFAVWSSPADATVTASTATDPESGLALYDEFEKSHRHVFRLLIPVLASMQSLATIGLLTLFLLALRRRFKMD